MKNFFTHKKGFTLVEIVVVIAIVGILASVVLANMQWGKQKVRDTQRISDLQQIQVALRMHRDANSTSLPSGNGNPNYDNGIEIGTGVSAIDTLIAPYVTSTLRDPYQGTAGYGYYYNSSYNCNGNHIVLVALTMEAGNGNFQRMCGAPAYPNIAPGITPTVDSYIVILK